MLIEWDKSLNVDIFAYTIFEYIRYEIEILFFIEAKKGIYPNYNFAKAMINKLVEVHPYIGDRDYLNLVEMYYIFKKCLISLL
jgi:hypothetical protein